MEFFKLFFVNMCLFPVGLLSTSLQKNAYSGISISFSDQVKQQHFDSEKLKRVLEKSSEYLYHATRKRAYFDNFVIVLPSLWTSDFCTESAGEIPEKVSIYVTNSAEESLLRTQHSKGCGEEGDIIYMPLSWLDGNVEDLARQFVKQWSIYRYGVFEEISIQNGACYVSLKEVWSPVGCYNQEISTKPEFSKDGLPNCDIPDEFPVEKVKSSLMTRSNFTKALDFCDGSVKFPHNPVMPTLHNNLCDGKTVWSVIENSKDFKYGENLPAQLTKPTPLSLKCYREQPIHLTFAVQTSTITDIVTAVQELRYSLHHFLINLIPRTAKINLVTFSDTSDVTDPVKLNLADDVDLLSVLEEYVETKRIVTSVCLLCGIQKALNVSQTTSHSSSTVVVIAWESALIGEKTSQLIKAIQESPKVRLHFILIEDTERDVTPTDLVRAVYSTGGFIHSLPAAFIGSFVPNVLLYRQLNVILSEVVRSSLQVDDKIVVVHEATYKNGTDIVDTFTIPSQTTGKLVYIMHCDLKGQIKNDDSTCSSWDKSSTTFKCGTVTELNKDTNRTWTYKFGVKSLVTNPICASTALLLISSSSAESSSLRGWFNEYMISPGQNALIIYAEVAGVPRENISRVSAHISGTGTSFEIELWDSGNGDPDTKAGDGIYSRYFTSFKEKGIYVVTVSVKYATPVEDRSFKNALGSADVEIVLKKAIGSFTVTSKPQEVDILPPSRVADLRIAAIDHSNGTVTLQWTSPGGDYDYGTAFKYEIKSALHPGNLQEIYFEAEEANLLKDIKNPKSSGEMEVQEFNFPPPDCDATYYVALRAVDAHENKGQISNIAQVHIKQSKVVITEAQYSSTEYLNLSSSSIPTTSSGDPQDTNTSSTPSSTVEGSTANLNITVTEVPGEEIIFDTKFIIVVSSFGGALLLLIVINAVVCCCCMRKRKISKSPEGSLKHTRKASLRPPYNLNIAYKQESQSIDQSETDINVSLSTLDDQSLYSSPDPARTGGNANPAYSYHTSKSLLKHSKSPTDTELGFKLVEAMPAYATSTLSRFAKKSNNDEVERENQISVAQPQQPSSSNETHIYALGVV